jgi:carbonic anhydrase
MPNKRLVIAGFVPLCAMWAGDYGKPAGPSAEVAQAWLQFGNERHVSGKYVHWHQTPERRKEVAKGQQPYAVIVSCSDSQVPPEIIFDQGLGDVFVVRVAGHAVGDKEIASIEYAAAYLRTPFIVVLGHQRCEALEAAISGAPAAGHLGSLLASLASAVSRSKAIPGDPLDNAIQANVETVADQLRNSQPLLANLVRSGRVKVAGAYYSLDSGEVRWLVAGPHPSARLAPLPH